MAERSAPVYLFDKAKAGLINKKTLKLWKQYERDMSLRELSQGTIDGYKSDAMQWFIYVLDNQDNKDITQLNEEDIGDFLYFCKEGGNNSRRIKRRMSTISAFYNYLFKKRKIKENPMVFIDRPKKDVSVVTQTFLTPEEVAKMKNALAEKVYLSSTVLGKENAMTLQVYALFSLSTMARVNAVRTVRWDAIDYESRMVIGVLEKEQKVVDLMFSREVSQLLQELKEYREEHNIRDGGFVFPVFREGAYRPVSSACCGQWSKKVGAMIGHPTLHPHDFRHSGATLLKNAGMSLEDVSALLNHSGTDVTRQFYIKEDKTKIRSAKDKFEGVF